MAGSHTRLLMLIDEDAPQLSVIAPVAAREGFEVLTVRTYAAALETLGAEDGPEVDILLFDGDVAGDKADSFIREAHRLNPD